MLHAIGKIERLRKDDESVDALIEVLTAVLRPRMEGQFSQRFEPGWSGALIDAVAARVLVRISSTPLSGGKRALDNVPFLVHNEG